MASCDPPADTVPIDREEEEVLVPGPRGAEEDPSSEGPRKRMKTDHYGLETYEKLEADARNVLQRTYEKLSPKFQGRMTDGIKYLKEQLTTWMEKTSLDPICIGFLGHTGTGKTSLLNTIIGCELFLPVSGIRSCTSCTVQVRTTRSEHYEATVHLLSEEEWNEELRDIVKVLEKNQNEDESDYPYDSVEDATAKLIAIYGSGSENKSYEELLNTVPVEPVPAGRILRVEEREAERFSEKLEHYIRGQSTQNVKFWPLIKYVEVTIPGSDIVPEGVTFMDIPGSGDFNRKRDEMWKQSIAKCSVLWIISGFPRVDTESDLKMFLDASIKAYLGGMCTDIAVVVTKADSLKLAEYNRERRDRHPGPPLKEKRNAILERNQDVKEDMNKSIKEELKKRLPPDSKVIKKPNLIYVTSVEEFWERTHLRDKKDTEIPKLREYVKNICLKWKKKLVTDYVTGVYSILLIAESIGSGHHLLKKHFPESVDRFVKKNIESLDKRIETRLGEIRDSFSQGVQKVKENCEKIVTDLLTSKKGNQGFHKTLKAVCLKNGVHVSRSLGRIDFNDRLANHIYEEIGVVYECLFRVGIWADLETFRKEVLDKLRRIGRENSLPDGSTMNETFISWIQFIFSRPEALILNKKVEIFKTPVNYIQDQLKPHYKAASQISGPNACKEMQESLKNSINNEMKAGMFEKAQDKMEKELWELKEMIMKVLEAETLRLFHLISQQEQQAVNMPDIGKECKAIREIHGRL